MRAGATVSTRPRRNAFSRIQGQGSTGCRSRRQDAGRAGAASMTCIPTRSSTGRIDCWPRRLTCSAASRDQTLMRRMGITAATPQAEHEQTSAGALDLPVPAAHAGDHALESRLGDGHQLHPDGAWLRLSGRRDRLAQPTRAGLASVDLDGHGVLYRGRRRRRSPSTASRRSSTPTRAVSLGSGNRRNIDVYNTCRPHSSHRARTPHAVYFASLPQPSAEAAWPRSAHL